MSSMVGTWTLTFLHVFKLCSEYNSQLLRPCDSSTVGNTQLRHTVFILGTISVRISVSGDTPGLMSTTGPLLWKFCWPLGKRQWLPSSGRDQTLELFTQVGKMCCGQEDSKYGRIFKCKYTKPKKIKTSSSISHYIKSILEKHFIYTT